jgi:predicted SAM-dependent methyltransferase
MKLHLGCGQRYLEGYVNIDYPLSEHSVQQKSVADKFADLKELNYKAGSIEEVRLHHVFEHFQRTTACAFLAGWNSWLAPDGMIRIEVPDFKRTSKVALSRWTSLKEKSVAIRHIFGSQEAHWAVHYQGYTELLISTFVELYGFKTVKISRIAYLGTHNIDLFAKKVRSLNKDEADNVTSAYLKNFLLDSSPSELLMLDTWIKEYSLQVSKTFASE